MSSKVNPDEKFIKKIRSVSVDFRTQKDPDKLIIHLRSDFLVVKKIK